MPVLLLIVNTTKKNCTGIQMRKNGNILSQQSYANTDKITSKQTILPPRRNKVFLLGQFWTRLF